MYMNELDSSKAGPVELLGKGNQSRGSQFTSIDIEYTPINNVQLIATKNIRIKLLCSAAISKRYRLFEGDSTTGSINSPLSPTSIVGVVSISSSIYSSINNQLCQSCTENRYEVCFASTNRCQCPVNAYWNGSLCALQRFGNATCEKQDACRSDLNLTCATDCYGNFLRCLPLFFDMTVAGGNGPGLTANQHYRPTDIFCSRMDGSVYIACANNNRIQKWQTNATFGITIAGNLNGIAGQTPYLMNKTYGIALYYEEKHPYVSDSYNNRIQRFSLR
ncbi:unnamed protein product [Rotaria magnacalcarata]|uniref:Uncharacterized protein n=1 Tax=Rotaria magnacalcarata TaxID=392030 RepID=A0A816ZRW6_9BILA|nr:unnamed protein product [Rotaria magnacalcarata]